MIDIFKDLAKGWKIIGDGWGGNLLILCERSMSKHIVEELTKNFYLSPQNQVLLSDDIEQYIKVVGKPAHGIGILDPTSEIWFWSCLQWRLSYFYLHLNIKSIN